MDNKVGRNRTLDILKGAAVLLMVFEHATGGIVQPIQNYILSFHMPLFFIVSGYLWKGRSFKEQIKNGIMKLIVPWLNFVMVYTICWIVYAIVKKDFSTVFHHVFSMLVFPTDLQATKFASPLWFLPCMFITTSIYAALHELGLKYSPTIKWIGLCVIGGGGAAYSSMLKLLMLPFALEPTCAGLLFFHVGFVLRKHYRIDDVGGKALLFLITCFAAHAVLSYINGFVDMRSARYLNVPLFFINGILGTLGWLAIAKLIENKKPSNYLVHLSENSINYLCINYFVCYVVRWLSNKLVGSYNGWTGAIEKIAVFIVILFVCLLCSKMINRYFPFLIGKHGQNRIEYK